MKKIFAGSDSDFDSEIKAITIRANAIHNADSNATSDKSGNVEPRVNIFDPQPSTSTSRGLNREGRRRGRVKSEHACHGC